MNSYKQFLRLQNQWAHIESVAIGCSIAEEVIQEMHQSWHDTIFTDEERAVWGRWISGGTATPEEWKEVTDALA